MPPAAQAAIAGASAEHEAGRATSPMMLAVALAALGGPALASLIGDAAGWTAAALAIGSALPLVLAGAGARAGGEHGAGRRLSIARYSDARGVRAGWIVSACVLAGRWTVLTRIAEALGPGGLSVGDRWTAAAPLTGAIVAWRRFISAPATARADVAATPTTA